MIMFMDLSRTMYIAVRKRGHLRAETTEDISFLVVRSKIAYSNTKGKKERGNRCLQSRIFERIFETSEGNVPEGLVLRAAVALSRCLPSMRSSC